MKNPATVTLEELADIAKKASVKADQQARAAGIEFAGIVKKPTKNKRPEKAGWKTRQVT